MVKIGDIDIGHRLDGMVKIGDIDIGHRLDIVIGTGVHSQYGGQFLFGDHM
jgi:hypothetical protein